MADVIIYAFNDGYQLASGLKAIIQFMGGPDWNGFIYMAALFSVVAGIWVAKGVDIVSTLKGIIMPVLIFNVLFSPTIDVHITDDFTGEEYNVDGVPLGVGYTLGMTTALEKALREMADDYLQPVTGPKFKDWDFLGHIRSLDYLLQKQMSFNSELYQSIAELVNNCVLHSLSNGAITVPQLANSPDLGSLFSAAQYTVFLTKIYNSDGTESIVPCDQAYTTLFGNVSVESSKNTPDSPAGAIRNVVDKRGVKSIVDVRLSLDNLFNTIFPGYQNTAQKAFEQMYWINGIRTSLSTSNPELLAYWTEATANQRQQSMLAAMSYLDNLNTFIPMLRLFVVFLFPAVGIAFLLSSGRPFIFWFTSMCFVSLWMPSEAVVHAITNHFILDELQDFNLYGGITYKTHLGMNQALLDVVGPASMIAMSIPGLAAMILGWIAPKVASAVTSPLMLGTHRLGMLAQASGGKSQMSTIERAKTEEEMKLNEMWDNASRSYQFSRDVLNDWHNRITGPFGQAPGIAAFTGGGITRGEHLQGNTLQYNSGITKTLNEQSSHMISRGMQSGLSKALTYSLLTQEGRQAAQNFITEAVNSNSFDQVLKSNKLYQAAFDSLKKKGIEYSNMDAATYSRLLTEKASEMIAGHLGINVGGTGVGYSDQIGYDNSLSLSKQDLDSIRKSFGSVENFKNSISDTIGKDLGIRIGQGINNKEGFNLNDAVSKNKSINDAITNLKSFTKEYREANSVIRGLNSSSGASGNFAVNLANIFGGLNRSHLLSLGSENLRTLGFKKTAAFLESGQSDTQIQSMFQREFQGLDTNAKVGILNELLGINSINTTTREAIAGAKLIFDQELALKEMSDVNSIINQVQNNLQDGERDSLGWNGQLNIGVDSVNNNANHLFNKVENRTHNAGDIFANTQANINAQSRELNAQFDSKNIDTRINEGKANIEKDMADFIKDVNKNVDKIDIFQGTPNIIPGSTSSSVLSSLYGSKGYKNLIDEYRAAINNKNQNEDIDLW